jgi:hypothetical protein
VRLDLPTHARDLIAPAESAAPPDSHPRTTSKGPLFPGALRHRARFVWGFGDAPSGHRTGRLPKSSTREAGTRGDRWIIASGSYDGGTS